MTNPHGKTISFGKHKGKLITRVPRQYLAFMVDQRTAQWELAKAELKRRGSSVPEASISPHAVDMASLRAIHIWQEDSLPKEGLYSWLVRITVEASQGMQTGQEFKVKRGKLHLVIVKNHEMPNLKTVIVKIRAGKPKR